jgi:phosphate transport system substrate-binding protein
VIPGHYIVRGQRLRLCCAKIILWREAVKTGRLVWLSVIGLLMVLSGPQVVMCQEQQAVRISGALPLSDLVGGWAADYMKEKPKAQITVAGKSAAYGYSQFLDGQANLVMATRPMTADEQQRAAAKGIRVAEKFVMNIGIAIITNVKNPVSSLTLEQLRDIYAGPISNWKAVGGPDEAIKVLQRPYPDTGAAVLFKEEVLKDLDYRKDAVIMSSFKNMVHICEQSMAIGHMPNTGAFCDPAKYHIKILALKKDANSPAVLPDQPGYPLNMAFFFAWNADAGSKEIEDFVQYAVAKAKQSKGTQGSQGEGSAGK